jgi:hypothetical protein
MVVLPQSGFHLFVKTGALRSSHAGLSENSIMMVVLLQSDFHFVC